MREVTENPVWIENFIQPHNRTSSGEARRNMPLTHNREELRWDAGRDGAGREEEGDTV